MRTVLVTGGAGFIGGTFVRQLMSQTDWRVINLDALTYASSLTRLAEFEGAARYHFVHGDIGDRELVGRLLREHQCDTVANFAAESHVDRSITSPGSFVHTNVVGTFELLAATLEYCDSKPLEFRERFRFLQVSTDEVYGSLAATGHFSESSPYQPNSPYSASKAASDHFVRAYHRTFELPTITTNCSNNYGPYQFPEKLIPLMTLNALTGKSLPVYGDGLNVRDWVHVEDHCLALQLVIESGTPGEVYNIGGDCEKTNLEVVNAICEVVDRLANASGPPAKERIAFVTDRPGHDFRYAIDCKKIQGELGWKPIRGFSEGIEQTVRWYAENSEWLEEVSRR